MFESISERINGVLDKLKSRGRLTEANIQEGMREIRMALLEADVNYKVAKDFVKRCTEKSVGQDVLQNIRPGQQVVKVVYDELVQLFGPPDTTIHYSSRGPTVIMMCGLQGSGKTTTCGKLARYLVKKGRRPLLVAADLQRPAAVEQLRVLGKQLDIPVFTEEGQRPPAVCEHAVRQAERDQRDVVILDTAGRLHVDEALMAELREVAGKVQPDEVFLVCDAMTGQDAVNSAKEFNDQLTVTGLILTKLDGDARGGAALSIRAVTGRPIKFVGTGEKAERLEEFHGDRMADRILGMGDVRSLVEKAQETVDQEKAMDFQKKFMDADISLDDFLAQLQQVKKMGPIQDLLGMIPGMGKAMGGMQVDDKEFGRLEAIIQSMTRKERRRPDSVDGSRRRRISRGSGTTIHDVNDLLKQFKQLQKMMKQMKKSGLLGRMIPRFGMPR